MMKKDSFKKLGIVGVSFALMASPLAFAEMQDDDEPKTGTTQESDINNEEGLTNSSEFEEGSDQDPTVGQDVDDPKAGTRQQSDLDEQGAEISTGDEGDDEGVPGTGAQTDVDTGTRGQPDLDEDDDEE